MISPPSKAVLDTVDEVVKVTAVLVGGAWTYLNYARGRTFQTRLEIDLSGTIGNSDGAQFFVGECKAKNVGLSKIPLKNVGTGVMIYALRSVSVPGGHRVAEEEVVVRDLFSMHGWIEPGETIADPIVIAIPPSSLPLLGVRMAVMISNGKTTWNASAITQLPAEKEKEKDDA
jgi:hypothetical protein